MFFMFFFSVPTEKKQPKRELAARSGSEPSERRNKRELVARFRLDKMPILRTVLRDSLRSNRSSHRLTAPYSVAVSVAFPSRYRSHIRAKVEGAHSKVKAPSPLERAGERLLIPKPPL